jgi:hypothetical protein
VRRLIPWALVALLVLAAALTIALTEASKSPAATPAALKAAQLSPSDLGKGWKVEELRAATATAARGLVACPGHPTIAGPYSRASFFKFIGPDPTSFSVLLMQPSVGAQAAFDTLVQCGSATLTVPGETTPHRISAFDGLGQASAGVIQSGPKGSDPVVYGWFVQGNDFVSVEYLGPVPLSQVRQWAATVLAKVAANT